MFKRKAKKPAPFKKSKKNTKKTSTLDSFVKKSNP